MKKARILAATVAMGLSGGLMAAPEVPLKGLPFYWGVSYAWTSFSQDLVPDEAQTGALAGRFGYRFHEMVSAEARYLHGIREDDINGISVDLDYLYGAYGKVNLLTDIDLKPYAIIGYSAGKASSAIGSTEEDGASYGVGVDFCRDQPVCLNAEYMSYLSDELFDANSYSIGLRIDF